MNHKDLKKKRRTPVGVMAGLIGMIKPLLGYMTLAVIMGTAGHLFAAFITILGGYGILRALGIETGISGRMILTAVVVFAVGRGILRYLEQSCNHYIAFKLLARIRHKVFAALRKLAPAKLEGKEKGNLISIITSDIEQLEVFYAHTISPIAIAVLFSLIMSVFMGSMYLPAGILAVISYLIVGFLIPVCNHKMGRKMGEDYRREYGNLNTQVLDNLYGMEEILQFGQAEDRIRKMEEKSRELSDINMQLKKNEGTQRAVTDAVILLSGFFMFAAGCHGIVLGKTDFPSVVICVIALMSSFGPAAALSALSNNLTQTLASGSRVLDLLEEEPAVEEITAGTQKMGKEITAKEVSFSYADRNILEKFNITIRENSIHGILGKSGCGKSTLLKLCMRFFEVSEGAIHYGNTDVNEINTHTLRKKVACVSQETFLFQDTIENNIKLADQTATREMVIEAAKKASVHEFICSLPKGYDTCLSELGNCISGGERQRIGLARAFLHKSDILLLDEPTSNIDSLNEGIILKSICEEARGKTVVLVSHRKSTMGIADTVTAL